ncbi:MAG: serine hydrolase domain-containing protein [Paludibaculum sp.]
MNRPLRIQQTLQKFVDQGELAGAATAVWRDGVLETACAGWQDIEAGIPIERRHHLPHCLHVEAVDLVAALMLLEEGKLALEDPISRFAPEFTQMRVLRSATGSLEDTEACERPITVADLLTHRSGLTYGDFHRGPIAQASREALGADIDSHRTPDDWIRRLAGLPLVGQPGSAMFYGQSTDLLGFLIARIEGTSLGAVLHRRIFAAAGMKDTGFDVPPEHHQRRACAYGFDESGRLMKCNERENIFAAHRPPGMSYESGGGGLWSTLDDYTRFARLFLGDGEVDGVRLLKPQTLAMMMSNQLTDEQRANSGWLGQKPFAAGLGFGLGVSVVLQTSPSDMMRRGSVGTVSWPGAFGGWWHADPKENCVLVFLAHNMVDLAQMGQGIGLGVWAAIEQFQTAALGVEVAD